MIISGHLTHLPLGRYNIPLDGFGLNEPFIDGFDTRLIREEEDGIYIPTGLLPRFLRENDKASCGPITYEYICNSVDAIDINTALRDYQVEAVKLALKYKRGVIKLPTAAGKSWIIGEIVRQCIPHGRVLIIVSTRSLLHQMRSDISKYLSINESDISSIGDGHKDLDLDKTISICTNSGLYEYKDDAVLIQACQGINHLLIDEAHTICNLSGWALSKLFPCSSYRIGLTATPWSERFHNLLEAIIGPIIYDGSEREIIDLGYILEPKVMIYKSPKTWAPPGLLNRSYSPFVYNQLYKHLILNNQGRNKLIAQVSKELLDSHNNPGCIVVDRVSTTPSHPDLLIPYLEELGVKDIPIIHGKTSTKIREALLDDLRTGKVRFAIFGPGVLKEGVNIPLLGWIILANAGKSDRALIQRVGRILRLNDGKEQPIVVDFIDQQSFFLGQSNKRQEVYRAIYGDCIEYV